MYSSVDSLCCTPETNIILWLTNWNLKTLKSDRVGKYIMLSDEFQCFQFNTSCYWTCFFEGMRCHHPLRFLPHLQLSLE